VTPTPAPAAQSQPAVGQYDFTEAIKALIKQVNSQVRTKGQKLRVMVDRQIPGTVVGDRQRMTQAIMPLIESASRALGEGGVITLKVDLHRSRPTHCTLRFTVEYDENSIAENIEVKLP
jgi:signal transduction histidine kinase